MRCITVVAKNIAIISTVVVVAAAIVFIFHQWCVFVGHLLTLQVGIFVLLLGNLPTAHVFFCQVE